MSSNYLSKSMSLEPDEEEETKKPSKHKKNAKKTGNLTAEILEEEEESESEGSPSAVVRANSSNSWTTYFGNRRRSSENAEDSEHVRKSEASLIEDIIATSKKSAPTFAAASSELSTTVDPDSEISAPTPKGKKKAMEGVRFSDARNEKIELDDNFFSDTDDNCSASQDGLSHAGSSKAGSSHHSNQSGGSNSSLHLQSDVVRKILKHSYTNQMDYDDVDKMEVEQLAEDLKQERLHRRFLEEIASESDTGVIVAEAFTHNIIMGNKAAQKIFGLIESDMIGSNVKTLMHAGLAKRHDSIVQNYMEKWRTAGVKPVSRVVDPRNNVPRRVVSRRLMLNGEYMDIHIDILVRAFSPMEDASAPPRLFIAFVRDVTEDVLMDRALKASRSLRSYAKDAIVVTDLHGDFIDANPAAELMFGHSRAFLVGSSEDNVSKKNLRLLMPPKTAKMHDEYLNMFRQKIAREGVADFKSPIVGKERELTGVRLNRDCEREEFSIVLCVNLVPAGTVENMLLVAHVHEKEETIKFDEKLARSLFPSFLVRRFINAQTSIDKYVEKLPDVAILLVDVSGYTARSRETDDIVLTNDLKKIYDKFEQLAEKWMGIVVDKEGDSNLLAFVEGRDKKQRALRAVCCASEMLLWSKQTDFKLSIGVHLGNVGSRVYGSKQMRTWKLSGYTVCMAARLQSSAVPNSMQISDTIFPALAKYTVMMAKFMKTSRDQLKGVDEHITTYRVSGNDLAEEELSKMFGEILARVEHDRITLKELDAKRNEIGDMTGSKKSVSEYI